MRPPDVAESIVASNFLYIYVLCFILFIFFCSFIHTVTCLILIFLVQTFPFARSRVLIASRVLQRTPLQPKLDRVDVSRYFFILLCSTQVVAGKKVLACMLLLLCVHR